MIEIKDVENSGSFLLDGTYAPQEDKRYYTDQPLILVKGWNYAGYSIGFVPPDRQDRKVFQGPLVPGPWAYMSPHASIMDDQGGTGAEIKRARERGLVYEVSLGDTVLIEGVKFTIQRETKWDNVNLKLVKVD